jgi:hypothetical protein
MKRSGIIITLLLIIIVIASCSKKPAEIILGEWKIADFKLNQDVSAEIKEAQKATFDEMKESSSLTFNQNGTYTYIITQDTTIGKWVITDDAKTLTLTYPDGQQEISKVIELSEAKLITSTKMNEFESTITYEKQKK